MYSWERDTNVYLNRGTNYIGKIALMYPSDIFYTYGLGVDNICYNDPSICNNSSGKTNSWIYAMQYTNNLQKWLLSSRSDYSYYVFTLVRSGEIGRNETKYNGAVIPTLYLSSQIKITSGDGTEANPYQLSM